MIIRLQVLTISGQLQVIDIGEIHYHAFVRDLHNQGATILQQKK